ncbi:MAG: molybdate ABC transporter permease subunit [Gammaproteobacteria bacterium]|nr:molybdate ABC transporter permease subunit [Gammaproteobacteria bacterium]
MKHFDTTALVLSLQLGLLTAAVLIPLGIVLARRLAWHPFRGRSMAQALIALPLILPPTVLGYYLLGMLSSNGPLGRVWEALRHEPLAFSFEGILLASLLFNIPFAIQPMQRAFEAIPTAIREAAWCSGLSNWQTFLRIELPLAWPGILTALVLTFAHTLGEFGVVLMVGGNIEGETRTISIAIYDRVQALDDAGAGIMSLFLLGLAFAAITLIYALHDRYGRTRPW